MLNFLKANVTLAIFPVFGLVTVESSNAATFVFKATNNSGVGINDFEGVFAGTGGTISNPMILTSPVAGAAITAPNPPGNGISITFPGLVAPGQMFTFKFDTDFDFPVYFAGGTWTINGTTVVDGNGDPIVPEVVSVPEPTSTLSILALGTLGAASTLKRKLKPSNSTEKELEKVS